MGFVSIRKMILPEVIYWFWISMNREVLIMCERIVFFELLLVKKVKNE